MVRSMGDSTRLFGQFVEGCETVKEKVSLDFGQWWRALVESVGLTAWRARKAHQRGDTALKAWTEPRDYSRYDTLACEGLRTGQWRKLQKQGGDGAAGSGHWESEHGGRVPVVVFVRAVWESFPPIMRRTVREYVEAYYGTTHIVLYPDQAVVQFELDTVKRDVIP